MISGYFEEKRLVMAGSFNEVRLNFIQDPYQNIQGFLMWKLIIFSKTLQWVFGNHISYKENNSINAFY